MATRKGTTVYLPEDQAKYIQENYKNQNFGIITAIEALMTIRKYSLNEIKGIFTSGEWSFFADSLNGTMTTDSFRCNAGALAYHCRDAEELDGTATKWKVDIEALAGKVEKLSAAQVEALYFRIENFWDSEGKNLEEFSKF
jgi:hypothetical protein